MKLLSLLFVFLLSACGVSPNIDSEILPYVQRFTLQTGIPVQNISIEFGNLTNGISGLCYPNFNPRQIYVDRFAWSHDSDLGKEETIYHELGHCIFLYQHIETLVRTQDGYTLPGSIMYPSQIGNSWYYQMYHQNYIDAFKQNSVMIP